MGEMNFTRRVLLTMAGAPMGASSAPVDGAGKPVDLVSPDTLRAIQDFVLGSIRRFVAANEDVAFDAAIKSGAEFLVPAGIYQITSDKIFPKRVSFAQDATLEIVAGVSVTFFGGIEAPLSKLFALHSGASVRFNPSFTVNAFPEWWGARTNDRSASAANVTAINEAIRSGVKNVQFQSGDYWLASSVLLQESFVTLRGVGRWWDGETGSCTRLLADFADGPAILLGPSVKPSGGMNTFQRNNAICGMAIQGAMGPKPRPPGGEAEGPIGVLAQYAQDFDIDFVRVDERTVGFALHSCVNSRLTRCFAFRSAPAVEPPRSIVHGSAAGRIINVAGGEKEVVVGQTVTGPNVPIGTVIVSVGFEEGAARRCTVNNPIDSSSGPFTLTYDVLWGFWLDGRPDMGAAGGNASTYLHACTASQGGGASYSVGLKADALFEDTFVRDFETSGISVGIDVHGAASTSVGNLNLQIDHPVIDTFGLFGVRIHPMSTASVSVTNGYFAPAQGVAPVAGISVNGYNGLMTLSGNEFVGIENTLTTHGVCMGLNVQQSSGIMSVANRFTDCLTPIFVSDSRNCSIADGVNNPYNIAPGPAITLSGSNMRIRIDTMILGRSGAFSSGIEIADGVTSLSEFKMTGVESSAIRGGASNRLLDHGAQILQPGPFSEDNLSMGAMK